MTDAALLSKVAALPAEMQAEVLDFVDFLVQKVARTPATTAAAVANPVVLQPAHQEDSRCVFQPLGPFTSDGTPRISLERGAGKHLITYIADDFDEPMEDFKDYM